MVNVICTLNKLKQSITRSNLEVDDLMIIAVDYSYPSFSLEHHDDTD